MARRPVFVVGAVEGPLVCEVDVDFQWYPGMSVQQKRRSIASLHEAARLEGIYPILEISTKSELSIGRQLSAFNLTLSIGENQRISVEAAFQGSKVFERGGPYRDMYMLPGRQIKRDERLRNSGRLIAFDFNGNVWNLDPKTAFYDWLYLHALYQNPDLSGQLLRHKGFTDIEFNPKKSINCQARAAALFVALHRRNLLGSVVSSRKEYLQVIANHGGQLSLPGM